MAFKRWNPNTITNRGNVSVSIVPAIADIENPKLTEIQSGTAIDCSITEFSAKSSTDTETVDWLCTSQSETIPSSTTHEIDDLTIKTSGQSDQEIIKALSIGDVVYIVRRDGIPSKTDYAVNNLVWVWKVVITSIDPAEASNTYVGIVAHVSVQARSATAVKIV